MSIFSLARSSRAMVRMAAGDYVEVQADARAISDLGWQITDAATNIAPNPRFESMVDTSVVSNGMTIEVVSGASDGLAYREIHVSGTATASSSSMTYLSDVISGIFPGDAHGFRVFYSVDAAYMVPAGKSVVPNVTYLSASSAGIAESSMPALIQPAAALITTGTAGACIAPEGTAKCRIGLRIFYGVGVTYNYRVRVYAPLLVKLAPAYGGELVANGDFGGGMTGWVDSSTAGSTFAIASGMGTLTCAAGGTARASCSVAGLDAGAVYRLTFDCGAGGAVLFGGGTTATSISIASRTAAAGTVAAAIFFVAAAGTNYLNFFLQAAGATTIDNVSLRKVAPGWVPGFPVLPPVGTQATSIKYADDAAFAQGDGGTPWAGYTEDGYAGGWVTMAEVSTAIYGVRTIMSVHNEHGHRITLYQDADGCFRGEVIGPDGVARVSVCPSPAPDANAARVAMIWDGVSIRVRAPDGDGDAVPVPASGKPGDLALAEIGRKGAADYLNGRLRKLHVMPSWQMSPETIDTFLATGGLGA